MKNKSQMLHKKFILFIACFFTVILITSLCSLATGTYAPLQTSTVTQVGICTEDSVMNPVEIVSPSTETLFICGIVTGETKKSLAIRIFYEEQTVFFRSGNWSPGEFFVRVNANQLRDIESDVFLLGNYRIGISYAMPIILESTFQVSKE